MTKKDYELIVRSLIRAKEKLRGHTAAISGLDMATHELVQALSAENPRFDRTSFYLEYDKEN